MQEIQEMQVQFLGQDIPWSRKWQLTPVFLPGTSHRQRSLVSYSPQSHKESYTTERLSIHTYTQKCLPFGKHHKILIIIITCLHPLWASMVAHGKESICQCRKCGFDPWIGKIPWRKKRNPLQYSCLGNPMDREAWQAAVHGVTEPDTPLWLNNNKTL